MNTNSLTNIDIGNDTAANTDIYTYNDNETNKNTNTANGCDTDTDTDVNTAMNTNADAETKSHGIINLTQQSSPPTLACISRPTVTTLGFEVVSLRIVVANATGTRTRASSTEVCWLHTHRPLTNAPDAVTGGPGRCDEVRVVVGNSACVCVCVCVRVFVCVCVFVLRDFCSC